MNLLYKGIFLIVVATIGAFINSAGAIEQKLFELGENYFYTIDKNVAFPWGLVETITQDSEGFMWFGTQSGAYRYDGYEFERFTHLASDPNSLAGDYVDYSFTSSNGTTILASNSGFSIFDPEKNNFLNYSSSLTGDQNIPSDYVTNFTETDQGIWGGTESHIIHLQPNDIKPAIHPIATITTDNQPLKILTIGSDHKNQIWLATNNGLYFSPGDNLNFKNPDKSWKPKVRRLYLDSKNRLWITTAHQGLHYIDPKGQRHKFKKGLADWPNKNNVNYILDTQNGELWMSTNTEGISVFDSKTLKFLRFNKPNIYNKNSILDDKIYSLFRDSTGLIWLGYKSSGIQIHNSGNKFSRQLFLKNENLKGKIANVVVSDDQKIWAWDRDIYMLDLEGTTRFTKQHNITMEIDKLLGMTDSKNKKTFKYKIDTAPDNSLILAPDSNNLFHYSISNGQLTKLDLKKKPTDAARIETLNYLKNHKIWMTSLDFSVTTYALGTGDVQTFKLVKNQRGYIRTPLLDSRDTIWFPTTKGLFYVDNSSDDNKPTAKRYKPFARNSITAVIEDHNEFLWVDTSIGLYRINLDNQAVLPENISQRLQQPAKQLFGNMYVDHHNRIWSDEGFLDIEKMELHRFLKNDGVPYGTNWLGSIDRTKEGVFILAQKDYLHLIWPDRYTDNSSSLRIGQLNAFVDQQPFPSTTQPYHLEALPKRIHFKFAAQEYRNPMDVVYSYQLTPYDDTWNKVDIASRSASYTQLAPGKYTLNVRATMNTNDTIATTSSLQFIIAKTWYQSAWFYCLILLLAVFSMWLLVTWRTARLRSNQKRLSALVFKRTEQLETSLDDLRDMQARLVQSEKQASLGRMVRGVAHELNTPLGVLKMATSMSWEAAAEVIRSTQVHLLTSDQARLQSKRNKSTSDLIEKNLVRLINLVSSFKSIAPDDNSDSLKEIELHDYLNLLNKQFPNQKITISGESNFKFTTYQSALNRIIVELINNSIKHNQNQAELEITASYGYDDFFPVNPYWICIKDNGAGMEAAVMEKAFDPFYTTVKDSSSTGLGLHMVFNNVTHQMNGEIEYESSLGHGASFLIRLPNGNNETALNPPQKLAR